jgi:hypothetical protein
MLADSLSAKLCPREVRRDLSCAPVTSPNMLSASIPPSTVGATLRTLALSSTSLVWLEEPRLRPKYVRAFEGFGTGDSSLDSFWWTCESAYEICVVAFETSCGRTGAVECDVVGLDPRKLMFLGRGGSGGGVPSRETVEMALVDVFRERLCIRPSVGFTKSCCSTLSDFLGVGVEGALSAAAPSAEGSALEGSDMAVGRPHLSRISAASALQ